MTTDPTEARSPELSIDQFVSEVMRRLKATNRVVDLFSVDELTPPFSRSWIKARLRDGEMETVVLHGRRLITGESLRAFLASAKPWEPPQ